MIKRYKGYWATSGGYVFIGDIEDADMTGKISINGIQIPRSGRFILFPGQPIQPHHIKEITSMSSVRVTLRQGIRTGDIVQVR